MFAASKTASVSGGYQISRSLRFNSADSAYLNRTPATTTNRKTWTWSGWIKRSNLSVLQALFGSKQGVAGTPRAGIQIEDTDALTFIYNSTGSANSQITTTAVYRDVSAWYHIILAVDTTQATNTNRLKLYVNGVQVTVFSTADYPTLNEDLPININTAHMIGSFDPAAGADRYFRGYMTEVNFIDGQALTPSSFGETNTQTGVWQPKAYSGSYGTNGFYLNFSDNSNTTAATLGKDYSGNGNNWTPNNFSVTAGAGNDSLVDSPTSYGVDTGVGGTVRGNYATLNPLDTNATLSNGNLQAVVADSPSSDYLDAPCTIGISSGAFYFECVPTAITSNVWCGITNTSASGKNHTQVDASRLVYDSGGDIRDEAVTVTTVASYTTNDVISVAFDRDAGTVKFYKNGTQVYTVTNSKWQVDKKFLVAGRGTWVANFGQRPFAYTAPSGFKALCTQNLPTPTIGATTATQANKYFDTVLRTGSGGATYSTTVNMANGALLWDKPRNQASSHFLFDSVRGIANRFSSNLTNAETSSPTWYTNFGNGSYTTGADDWGSPTTLVDWIWAAGTGTTNTAGSITSTVGANTTSGFSVVTYTGTGSDATVGHGLGVAPSMIIGKARNSALAWRVYHTSIGAANFLALNTTDASASGATWNSTTPTSTVFTVGGGSNMNVDSSTTYVAYCFAPIAGYSAFGSFVGNGSADGAFVYTGFRPAFVMLKASSTGGAGYNWGMFDNDRLGYNSAQRDLRANTTDTEGTDNNLIDFLSNGFKIRSTSGGFGGGSGVTYVYMAFAENPFKYSLAR